jgi:hypothetical protein
VGSFQHFWHTFALTKLVSDSSRSATAAGP